MIDSYFVTPDFLLRLHRRTHTICIDDLNPFIYSCSTLINYNIYASQWNYPDQYPTTQLLLGPQYTPLRNEFYNIPERFICEEVCDVLVTTGGSDAMNIAGHFVGHAVQIPAFSSLTFHIVVGRFNPHCSMLENLAGIYPCIKLHYNVQCMSELMLACDIAVSAAGTTLYELCACGIPTVTYVLANNQLPGAAAFAHSGMMLYAGDARKDTGFAEVLCDRLAELIEDAPLRKHMSARMQKVVDGNGAQRLAEKLISV